ncbi:hypothetical protein [Cupriavidus basilensis]|uniref:Uncharacterized protein n=1 Tax=Cupriavidus basilensis TaxID=68895 RepID=A0A643FKF6_9BURK|nr:hypothetical protein [Cupriavidus basilensis]QOT82047.1 hypothetical protein F7R26_037760 [Cupriavidus basilensis]
MRKLIPAFLELTPFLGISEAHAFRDSAHAHVVDEAKAGKKTPRVPSASEAEMPMQLAKRGGGHP